MSSPPPLVKKILWQEALWKALFACLIFWLLMSFRHHSIVRERFEDFSFDVINKFTINTQEQTIGTNSKNKVTVFAFDNDYMYREKLFDKDNIANYGYTFPRKNIAQFIDQLDTRGAT